MSDIMENRKRTFNCPVCKKPIPCENIFGNCPYCNSSGFKDVRNKESEREKIKRKLGLK